MIIGGAKHLLTHRTLRLRGNSGNPPPSRTVPLNTFTPSNPMTARVISNQRLTDPQSTTDVRHIVLNIQGSGLQFLEGQAVGILPPGVDAQGKPHKLRLYTIASPSVGEDGKGGTLALTIKRTPGGTGSNLICDLKAGDVVSMTGPVGKTLLMPEVPNANMILFATGTGVAPFRGFLKTRYTQNAHETGETWMFLGVPTKQEYLYGAELQSYAGKPGYHHEAAFSREQTNPQGGRMYVQDRIATNSKALIDLLQKPETYVYICGLKGMETGIEDAFQQASQQQGLSWATLLTQLKAQKRWRVETY